MGEMMVIFGILAITVVLFALEVFPPDQTAFLALVATLLSGTVTTEEALSGFANPAVITIMSLMILAAALEQNGVIAQISKKMERIASWGYWAMLPFFMVVTASISAFISTTAVVIVFIKLVGELQVRLGLDQRRLLLPISFAGILGGSCTLMGTSTNLLVNDILRDSGSDGFTFFEFSGYGGLFFAIALPIVTVLAKLFLKPKESKSIAETYATDQYLTSISIPAESKLVGKELGNTFLGDSDYEALRIVQNDNLFYSPSDHQILEPETKLLVKASLEKLTDLSDQEGIKILGLDSGKGEEYQQLHELIFLPASPYLGLSLKDLSQQIPAYMQAVAVQKHGNITSTLGMNDQWFGGRSKIEIGDRLLVAGDRERIQTHALNDGIILLRTLGEKIGGTPSHRLTVVLTMLLVIILAATGLASIVHSALIGVAICLLTRSISLAEAYRSISWQVVFLLAGLLPLGIAMHNTGADSFIAEQLTTGLASLSPTAILAAVYFIAMFLSGFVSNNATAIITAPIAISTAASLGLPTVPFVLAIMFGSNYSFFTPIGYQTNALIFGMGMYRFRDFTLIGGCLSVALWIACTLILSYHYF